MKSRILTQLTGISGMGKSYLAKQKLIPAIAKHQPVIIFDKNQEYAGGKAKDIPKGSNWKNHSSIHAFLGDLEKTGELEGVHIIQCTKLSDYDIGIRFFYSLQAGVCIILDEAHFIFDEPKLKELSNIIKNIARFGRHWNLSFVLISQRVMDIPPDVRSQFEGLISFKQLERADVDSLKSKGWENVESVLALEPENFKLFGVIPETIKNKLQ